ncbi:MAG: hypothetical protein WDN49_08985 [Acetobacteraceae bacterium]
MEGARLQPILRLAQVYQDFHQSKLSIDWLGDILNTPGRGGEDGDEVQDGDAPGTEPSHYVAHVALERASMMVDGREAMPEPGMAVTVEIKTGRRGVISLLSPLARYAHESGRER